MKHLSQKIRVAIDEDNPSVKRDVKFLTIKIKNCRLSTNDNFFAEQRIHLTIFYLQANSMVEFRIIF